MPSKHRFRILITLCVAFAVLLAPQLAGADTRRPSRPHISDSHRRHHRHGHHHHRHHRHHRPTTTTTRPRSTTPTTTTTTRPRSTTPTTTTTTRPRSTPVPDPKPVSGASTCLTRPATQTVSGNQNSRFKPSFSGNTVIDARNATWTQVDDWPVSITGSGAVCMDGGSIVGTYGSGTSWETFHHTGGFGIANPNSTVENLFVHNYGDAINIRDGASNWKVRGAHTTLIHDDCVQNDYLNAGVISDSLFDGCYVGLSTRASSSNSTSDGHTLTMTLETSLLRLQPMPTVYKGPAPGHGGFFKWDKDAHRSPRLAIRDNVFRVDQEPNHGSLGLPDGYDVVCSGNTIVWLGGGAFPEAASWLAKCPDTRIVSSRATWDNAVATWKAAH